MSSHNVSWKNAKKFLIKNVDLVLLYPHACWTACFVVEIHVQLSYVCCKTPSVNHKHQQLDANDI